MINVHASLLPRWRGASPIIYAILNEDEATGVSIMKIHPHKFDIGEILAQKKICIPKNVLMPELHDTLANEGAHLLLNCIQDVPNCLENSKCQDLIGISYGEFIFIICINFCLEMINSPNLVELYIAPKISDSMPQINWQTMTGRYICNLYRALFSFKWLTTSWHKRKVHISHLYKISI